MSSGKEGGDGNVRPPIDEESLEVKLLKSRIEAAVRRIQFLHAQREILDRDWGEAIRYRDELFETCKESLGVDLGPDGTHLLNFLTMKFEPTQEPPPSRE